MDAIQLKPNTTYSEADLLNLIHGTSSSPTRAKWELFELQKAHKITRVGAKQYVTNGKFYMPNLSETAKRIDGFLSENYPRVDYVIYETYMLNEWANLLFGKNVILVDVDKAVKDYVFSFVRELLGKGHIVLLDPDFAMVSRYFDFEPVVVKPLFSRSPKNKEGHAIALEKLLVDIFADRLLANFNGTYNKEEIAQGIIYGYTLNKTKALAYAKRRKCEREIERAWEAANDW